MSSALLFLAGCVGVTLHTETLDVVTPYKRLDRQIAERGVDDRTLSEQDVIAMLGQPKQRRVNDKGDVELDYDADIAWRGLTIWAVLPIPLVFPVGYNVATLTFINGRYRYATQQKADMDFWGCTVAACGHLGRPTT